MGSILKKYRKKRGMTQEELAEKSNVSRATISAIENKNIGTVNFRTLTKLADALDSTVDEIFFNHRV